jgi:hypothetical protein
LELPGKRQVLAQRWLRGLLTLLPVLLPLSFLILTALPGIDFGDHPDEVGSQIWPATRTIETGVALPQNYRYPDVDYRLTLAVLAPDALTGLVHEIRGRDGALFTALHSAVRSHEFHLRVRTVFLALAALSTVWVYLQVLAWGRHWAEALLAAALLGLSWEVSYHARWIAPDAVMMQFGALVMLGATLAVRRPGSRGWLVLAAVAVGLACGTKYPGGALLLPVLVAASLSHAFGAGVRGRIRALLVVGLVSGLTFLLTTPGALLESAKFAQDVLGEMWHYQSGHRGHTVEPGLDHLGRIVVYLTQVLFSHYPPIAVAVFLASLVGAYALCRESRVLALAYLLFPVAFLLFMSSQRVMFVRNLLVVAPFLALLAARGFGFAWEQVHSRLVRVGIGAAATTICLANAAWLSEAASTFSSPPDRFVREVAAYIEARPTTRFLASDRVWAELRIARPEPFPNLTRDPAAIVDQAIFHASETAAYRGEWPANRPGLTLATFGPQSVNLSYYPTFPIHTADPDPILAMEADRARALLVPATHFGALQPWIVANRAVHRLDAWAQKIFGAELDPTTTPPGSSPTLRIPLPAGPSTVVEFLMTLPERVAQQGGRATVRVTLLRDREPPLELREVLLDAASVRRAGWLPYDVTLPTRAELSHLQIDLRCASRDTCGSDPAWVAPLRESPREPASDSAASGAPDPTFYPADVLSDQPVAYWRLDSMGDGIPDSSAHGHDGVLNGVATLLAAGIAGNPGVDLDGHSGYVQIRHSAALNGVDRALSVEAWVRPRGGGAIVDKDPATGWSIVLGERDVRASVAGAQIRGGAWSPGSWHQVVLTLDRKLARLYVNGAIVGQSSFDEVTSTRDVTIGRFSRGSGFLSGAVDEVAIYDYPLPQARIRAHWARGISLAR